MKRIAFLLISFVACFSLMVSLSSCLTKDGSPVYTVDESNTLAVLTLKRSRGDLLTPEEQLLYDRLVQKGIDESHGIDLSAILRTLGTIGASILGGIAYTTKTRGPAKPMDPITASTLLDVADAVRNGSLNLKPPSTA